ncbi:MAG: hypothetical protein IIZ39_00810, partial [Blautia sp.]|nr:hypothetical protein [Blautia sp.]
MKKRRRLIRGLLFIAVLFLSGPKAARALDMWDEEVRVSSLPGAFPFEEGLYEEALPEAEGVEQEIEVGLETRIGAEAEEVDSLYHEPSKTHEPSKAQEPSKAEAFYVGDETALVGEGEGWSLSLLYYDSEAENPSLAMPVTDLVTWEADSYQERRQLGIQVHYTCVNAPRAYAPGEVELIVPDLGELFTGGRPGADATYECILAADRSMEEGEGDWYYEKIDGAYHLYNKKPLEQFHIYEG